MTRARDLSRLANEVTVTDTGLVGVGSTQPKTELNVVGVVSATSFYGDGTNLSNTGSTLSAASGSQRVVLTSLTSGTMTASSTDANVTYNATTQTLSVPNVSIAGTLTYEDVTNVDSVGLITARNGAIINAGTATTALIVSGNARVTGILTIGTSSVTLDGTNNQVNVGTGVTIHHTNGVQVGGNTVHSTGLTVNQINVTGVVTATSFVGNGSGLTGVGGTADVRTNSLVVSGVSTFAAGSLSNPSISASGDSNTGVYFPDADTIQVVTGGNSRVRVSAGGTVLVNTTSSEGIVLKAVGTGWGGGNGSGTISGRSDAQFIFEGVGLDNSGSVTPVGFQIRGSGGGVPRGFPLGVYGKYNTSAEGHVFFVTNTGNSPFNQQNSTPYSGYYMGTLDAYASPANSSWWAYSQPALFGIRDARTSIYDGSSRVGQTIELGGTYGGGSPGAWGGTCSAVRIATNFGSGSSGTNIGYYADISNAGSGNNWGLYIANGGAAKPGGGSFTATSDARVKNVLGNYTRGLDEISQLNPIKFTYNGKAKTPTEDQERIGLLAQEVQPIIPEIVSTRLEKLNEEDEENTEILMVDPSDLVFALVNACKDLKSQIETLQSRLDAAGL
jgi:hypothetical protein